MALPNPVFFTNDPNEIVQDLIAYFEAEVGRTLQPAQVERLLINAFAYRESVFRVAAQIAAEQNLVAFAQYPFLDYLGELVGVTRLPETAAEVVIEFTVTNVTQAVIPAGTRVSSNDGQVVFEVIDPVIVPGNSGVIEVLCRAQVPGTIGNGYIAGNISTIRDPLPFVTDAANIATSAGGTDQESDDNLRERIKLAPEAFSIAGSTGAYKFHASSADPTIVDVAVVSPFPGQVNIYPLVQGAIATPTNVLTAVQNICSSEKVRPLTDTVVVQSPNITNFTCTVQLTLYVWADQTSVEQAVEDRLTAYFESKRQALGQDIVINQIVSQCMVDGVYSVNVASPVATLVISETAAANCTSITVTTTGVTNG